MQFSKLTLNIECEPHCDALGRLKEVQDLQLLKVTPGMEGRGLSSSICGMADVQSYHVTVFSCFSWNSVASVSMEERHFSAFHAAEQPRSTHGCLYKMTSTLWQKFPSEWVTVSFKQSVLSKVWHHCCPPWSEKSGLLMPISKQYSRLLLCKNLQWSPWPCV